MANATRGSGASVILFIEILNKYVSSFTFVEYCTVRFSCENQGMIMTQYGSKFRYLYCFEKGKITVNTIQDLMELITTEMQGDNATADPAAEAFFANTLRYIQFQKQKGGAVSEGTLVVSSKSLGT